MRHHLVYMAALSLALGACAGGPESNSIAEDDATLGSEPSALQSAPDTAAADHSGDETNIDTGWVNREETAEAAAQDEFHPYHYSDNHAQPDPL